MGWMTATGGTGHRVVGALAALLALLTISAALPAAAAAGSNPIVLENQQPGTSAWDEWNLSGTIATDAGGQIKGYASAVSVNKGQSITFYVSVAPAQTYSIDVYRIGWYQGLGGRLMQHIGPLNGTTQPTCPTDSTTGEIACNWASAYTLATQTTWTSGVYEAILTNAANYHNAIMFVVRDDGRTAALLYQQPVNTYQAYNDYPNDGKTGKSLYDYNSYGAKTVTGTARAAKVSFDRPYDGPGYGTFESWEIQFVRWMEKNGYDVTYSTDVDTDTNAASLLNYRGFLSVGHNEYWSKNMYNAAINALAGGVNLGFFGADAIYWQVRYEPSASGVPDRVLVCYKDASIDPTTDPSTTTVNWREPPLNRPEQSLIGVMYEAQTKNEAYIPYVVTNASDWIYAGTGFKNGDSVPGLVGYEADQQFSSYPFPNAVPGTYLTVSNSPFTNVSGQPDHANSSIYQAPSGAWVFGAGTIAWSWGLDNYGNFGAVDPRIQQTTANILNQFSQPLSEQLIMAPSGLAATSSSTSSITLNWTDNSPNETNFVLQRGTDSSFSTATSIVLPADTTSYTDTGLSPGTYYYRVQATNSTASSAWSGTASTATLPAAPSALAAAAQSATSVALSWTDSAANATAYAVERSPDGASWSVLTSSLPATATSYVDSTAQPITTYYYRVRAINAGGSSGYAGPVSVTTPNAPPNAPRRLTASAPSGGGKTSQRVVLTWIDNSTNETNFVLQRATNSTFTAGVVSTTLPASTTTYTDSSVARSTTYYYRVQAVNSIGASAWSNVAAVKTK
jgi:Fibronectin type III domain